MESQWSLSRNRYPRSNHFHYNYDRDDEEDNSRLKNIIGDEENIKSRSLLLFHRMEKSNRNFLNWADFKEDGTRGNRSLPDSCRLLKDLASHVLAGHYQGLTSLG